MEWVKQNIVSVIIGILLSVMGFVFNDKLNELKETKNELKEVKEMVIEIKAKMEADQSQKFDRYEQILNDLQNKLEKL
jgi:uncharacterized membrane protein (DUF106 family)